MTDQSQTDNSAVDAPGTTPPATSARMVPESDLLAVKSSAGKAKEDYETSLNSYKLKLNDAEQDLVKSKAGSEQLEDTVKQLRESAIPQEKLDALTQERDDAVTSVETFKTTSLELRRANIVLKHKVPEDKVAAKTLAELDMFEEALTVVGAGKNGGNYATGGIGGLAPATKLESAASEIAAARDRAKKRGTAVVAE